MSINILTIKLNGILINLDIISRLEPYQRPVFKNDNIIIRKYYNIITGIIRTLSYENRNDIIDGLRNLYISIINIINEYNNNINIEGTKYDKNINYNIITSFERLTKGIEILNDTPDKGLNALNKTYESDPEFLSKLHILCDEFNILNRLLYNKIEKLKDQIDL